MIELGKTYFNTAGRPVCIVCVDRIRHALETEKRK